MFPDIGGAELIIVAVVALLVFKPQDLPVVMRKFGEFMNKARRMASDFRASFDDMARQSELDELRKEVEAMRAKAADPMGLNSTMSDMNAEISQSLSDPNFDYGNVQTEHIPWEDPAAVVEAPKPARKKAAPKKPAAKKAAAPAVVEGGPKPVRKTPAKRAAKTVS